MYRPEPRRNPVRPPALNPDAPYDPHAGDLAPPPAPHHPDVTNHVGSGVRVTMAARGHVPGHGPPSTRAPEKQYPPSMGKWLKTIFAQVISHS